MSGSDTGEALAPLTVHTDLDVTVAGRPVDVASTGDRLFLDFPSLRTARAAARAGTAGRVRQAASALAAADLTAEVRVRDRPVLVLGADARPGILSREAGVAPAELRLGGALGAVGREAAALVERVRRVL